LKRATSSVTATVQNDLLLML